MRGTCDRDGAHSCARGAKPLPGQVEMLGEAMCLFLACTGNTVLSSCGWPFFPKWISESQDEDKKNKKILRCLLAPEFRPVLGLTPYVWLPHRTRTSTLREWGCWALSCRSGPGPWVPIFGCTSKRPRRALAHCSMLRYVYSLFSALLNVYI